MDKVGFATAEAAKYMGVGRSTLEKMRMMGTGPRYSKVGGRVIYTKTALDAYLQKCEIKTA